MWLYTFARNSLNCTATESILLYINWKKESESESRSVVSDWLFETPWTIWNSPAQKNGVRSHSLLQGSNPGLLHSRQILYHLSHQGSPYINYTSLNLSSEKALAPPLQHSCLRNPMNRGAWWAAVHGVAKSQTRLSDFTLTFHFHALEKEMATDSSVLA